LTERNRITIVTDPFSDNLGLPVPKLKADVVTVSHDEPGHNNLEAVKGTPRLLNTPGEYEIGGVFIAGIPMHTISETSVRQNVAFSYKYDNLSVLHLGDLAHIPDQSTIEDFGEVHVLFIPVGGGNALRASQAAEMISLIEPYYVVPMHYGLPNMQLNLDPLDKFLRAVGMSNPQVVDSLKITASDMPEQPQIVVLQPQFPTLL